MKRRVWKKGRKRRLRMSELRFKRIFKVANERTLSRIADEWCERRIAPLNALLLGMVKKQNGDKND